jgi:hypothetical protein
LGRGLFLLPIIRRSLATLRTTINGGGISPLLQLHPKHKMRRSLATLEMTGYENHFSFLPLGKSWKGGIALVPIFVTPKCRSEGSPLLMEEGK